MKNIEYYNDELLTCSSLAEAHQFAVRHGLEPGYCYANGQSFCSWLYEDAKILLSKEEKEYLSKVISPYRKHIVTIRKALLDDSRYELICDGHLYYDQTYCQIINVHIPLYGFEKDWLKNMKINHEYTLMELDLRL